MITEFKLFESKNIRYYKGYKIIKNPDKSPGENGLWFVPDLYWRKFANKIEKGFKTVSILQCKEAIEEWFDFNLKMKQIYDNYSYDKILKFQQEGDPAYDLLFSNETSEFIEENINILKLRELNGFSNEENDEGIYDHTLTEYIELGLDEDESITKNLFDKIVEGIELNPIVVDENYKILDGRHRLAAYSELYFYYSYDFYLEPNLKIFKRIKN